MARGWVLVLAIAGAAGLFAACEPDWRLKGEPCEEGDRIDDAAIAGGRLWISTRGELKSFDLDALHGQIEKETKVALFPDGETLWTIPVVERSWAGGLPPPTPTQVERWSNGVFGRLPDLPLESNEQPLDFISDGDRTRLLTDHALLVLDRDEWIRTPLSKQLDGFQISTAKVGKHVYVADDMGEWGGAMWRVNLTTAAVEDICIRNLGAHTAAEKACRGVRGITSDPDRPDCMLAATGTEHFGMVSGELLRVCGTSFEHAAAVPYPPEWTDETRFGPGTSFYGLASNGQEVWGLVSPFKLVRFEKDSVVEELALEPRLVERLCIARPRKDLIVIPGGAGSPVQMGPGRGFLIQLPPA